MNKILRCFALLFFITCAAPLAAQTIVYVDSAATGLNNGTSWQNAYTDLQPALLAADSTQELWVAKGTYYPTHTTSRIVYFVLKNKVSMYGGFAGTETSITQRNTALNPTILSGDIGVPGDTADNSNHIVFGEYLDYPAAFDGFILEYGHGTVNTPPAQSDEGGAIWMNECKLVINDCIFRDNYSAGSGGAIWINYSYGPITNCRFYRNVVKDNGGGVYSNNVAGEMRNCVFEENRAYSQYSGHGGALIADGYIVKDCTFRKNSAKSGGAVYVTSTSPLYECVFDSNFTERDGGAIYMINSGHHLIYKCTFTNNYCTATGSGGAIYSEDSPYHNYFYSCTFTANNCLRQGGALYLYGGHNRITNCVFNNNFSHLMGGAIANYSSNQDVTISNSTFMANNSDSTGDAIFDYNVWSFSSKVTNCIFSGNGTPEIGIQQNGLRPTHVTYSLLQTPDTGLANIVGLPLFADADGADNIAGNADDDLHLQNASPGIDDGRPDTTGYFILPEDVEGNPRIAGSVIDMGAYERGNCPGAVSAAVAGNDTLLCNYAYSATLTAVPPQSGTGRWEVIEGFGTVNNMYATNTTVGSVLFGTTRAVWIVQSCGVTSTDTVTIVKGPVITTPVVSASGPLSFCTGDSVTLTAPAGYTSYLWSNGSTASSITVSAAGNYSVTVSDVTTCSATSSSTHVTVNNGPATPVITFTGDTILCGTETLTLHTASSSAYQWTTGATSSSLSVSNTGSYAVRVRNSGGCWSGFSDSVQVVHYALPPQPTVTISDSAAFCAGDSAVLTAPAGYATYNWNNGAHTQSITLYNTFTATLTVADAHGCTSPSSGNIGVVQQTVLSPNIFPAGSLDFCMNDSVVLFATGNYAAFHWSNGDTTFSTIIHTPGTYQVWAENDLGCHSPFSQAMVVTTYPLPAQPVITASGSPEFCQGQHITVTAPPGYAGYLWSTGATTDDIGVSAAGNVWVIVSDANGCSSQSDSITVIVNPLPAAPSVTASGPTAFCPGGSVTLNATAGYAGYVWSNNASAASITVTTNGSYRVKVTDANGCISPWSAYKEVQVYAPGAAPVISAAPGLTICAGDSCVLTASGNYTTYFWSNGMEGESITLFSPATLTVYATDQHGCTTDTSESASLAYNSGPATPVITLENDNDLSTTSLATHYYWLINDSVISNDAPDLTAPMAGIYSIIIETQGCLSDTSNKVKVLCPSHQELLVSPNPNKGIFNLDIKGFTGSTATLVFYNLLGARITAPLELGALQCVSATRSFDMGYLPEGVYFAVVEFDGKLVRKKWAVVK